jgi:hypothetical protein
MCILPLLWQTHLHINGEDNNFKKNDSGTNAVRVT